MTIIYKIRVKLSKLFFKWGRDIHPDISKLKKEIESAYYDMAVFGSGMLKIECMKSATNKDSEAPKPGISFIK